MLFEWVVNSNNLEAKVVVFTWEPGNISYSTCASESQVLLTIAPWTLPILSMKKSQSTNGVLEENSVVLLFQKTEQENRSRWIFWKSLNNHSKVFEKGMEKVESELALMRLKWPCKSHLPEILYLIWERSITFL